MGEERRSVHEPREPPPGSPALVHPDELLKAREHLDRLHRHHFELTGRFLRTANLYSIDIVMVAVMSRSYSLVDGFINAFDDWNLVVAAPILRMQLDSLTRLAYIAAAPQSDEVAEYLLGGGEFRYLKDADSKKLTDRRLIEHVEEAHPWIDGVYKATSGWVHFSPEHIVASLQVEEKDGAKHISGGIPIRPEQIPAKPLAEVLGAMIKATEQIFGYVEAWESRKGLPLGEIREL